MYHQMVDEFRQAMEMIWAVHITVSRLPTVVIPYSFVLLQYAKLWTNESLQMQKAEQSTSLCPYLTKELTELVMKAVIIFCE